MANPSPPNSLGLDFDQLKIQEPESKPAATAQPTAEPGKPEEAVAEQKEKKKPYVNSERVKTGGTQRDKLSDEALTERMARIKEQNEKIKQRRLDVQADEDAFKQTQESERVKLAQTRKVQEDVNRARDSNAKRKMDKIQSREWDSGKPGIGERRQNVRRPPSVDGESPAASSAVPAPSSTAGDSGNWTRGAPRGGSPRARGRGRGRGRGGSSGPPTSPSTRAQDATTTDSPSASERVVHDSAAGAKSTEGTS
ncbi:hypothetical protein C8J56DRAFT_1097853 [Mycena floridula]|nr:hypothetical protein C8J56DRAFT_1097853 [Mycena floridula]